MMTIALRGAFASTLLFFLIATLPTTGNAYGLSKNTETSVGRRAFVAQGIAFTALATTRGKYTAVAAQDEIEENKENVEKQASRDSKNKNEEQERKKAEKEARRIAEETKKRLAVGRIGTI
jgi:hypothetical protein